MIYRDFLFEKNSVFIYIYVVSITDGKYTNRYRNDSSRGHRHSHRASGNTIIFVLNIFLQLPLYIYDIYMYTYKTCHRSRGDYTHGGYMGFPFSNFRLFLNETHTSTQFN